VLESVFGDVQVQGVYLGLVAVCIPAVEMCLLGIPGPMEHSPAQSRVGYALGVIDLPREPVTLFPGGQQVHLLTAGETGDLLAQELIGRLFESYMNAIVHTHGHTSTGSWVPRYFGS